MAAARYWRIVSLDSYDGSSLQMSEFGLFDGATRRDTGAVITSTVAPAAGSLSALNDGGFGSSVTFNAAQFRLPGFAIEWDLGSSLEVNVVRLATVSNATAPMVFTIQYQDGAGQWVTGHQVRGAKPSAGALGELMPTDPVDYAFPNNVLLLRLNGTEGSTSIVDESLNPKTVTAIGSAVITNTQSRFGGGSVLLNGGGFLEVPDSVDTRFGDADFTLECFFRVAADASQWGLCSKSPDFGWPEFEIVFNSNALIVRGTNAPGVGMSFNWSVQPGDTLFPLNVWNHVAITRQGSLFRAFVNGVLRGTTTYSSFFYNSGQTLKIGRRNASFAPANMQGFIDEFRFTKGFCRYVTNFDPHIEPYLPFRASPGSGDPIPLRTSPTTSPRLISYYRVPDPTTFSTRAPLSFDQEDAGRFRIVGTVKEVALPSNAPLRRRVLLIDEVSRRTIRETWSDAATGVYVFNQIAGAPRRYTVVSYDHTGQYRAVIADNLEAEPMT